MINKTFNLATLKILKSSQSIYYKFNTPSIDDMSFIYKQGNETQFEAAINGFKPNNVLPNGDGILHHFNKFYDANIIRKILESKRIHPVQKNGNGETALVHIAKNSSKEENGQILNKEQFQVISTEYFEKIYEINNHIKEQSILIGNLYINNGIDVNLTDIFGNNAIYYALKKNNNELALNISKASGFNPMIKYREEDYCDCFDLAIKNNSPDVALSIFISMNDDYKAQKMFEIKANLFIPESIILACESISDSHNKQKNKEILKANHLL